MSITAEDMEVIVRLSHFQLNQEEKQTLREEINEILRYAGQLNELDTEKIKPTAFIHLLQAIRNYK